MTKQRFFWDSKLAMWLEEKIYGLERWFLDKRYPVNNWSAELQPTEPSNNPPIIDEFYSPAVEPEVKITVPKAKKPRKKKTKKSSLVI